MILPVIITLILFVIFFISTPIRINNRSIKIAICILALIMTLYTELFNGFYTFNSITEFQKYNLPLKEYYYLTPFKVVKRIGWEADATVYNLNLFSTTDIKFDQSGRMSYYIPRWGGSSRWFEFGIPEKEQF